jgi:CRISPR type I-E-associated protein CasB/Cse2
VALAAAGISELRVRRLLASSAGEDVEEQLARVVRLLKRKVNIEDLLKTAIFWGDVKRRELARQYFEAQPRSR